MTTVLIVVGVGYALYFFFTVAREALFNNSEIGKRMNDITK